MPSFISGPKLNLALCAHPLIYVSQDWSLRLLEWLLLLQMQGYDKVVLPIYAVHPNMRKVG